MRRGEQSCCEVETLCDGRVDGRRKKMVDDR